MNRFVGSLLALLLAGAALAQGVVCETVALKYTKASETAKRLKAVPLFYVQGNRTKVRPALPAATRVVADDEKNTLTIEGSAKAVAGAKSLLSGLDSPPA